jgi:hypothetical protein
LEGEGARFRNPRCVLKQDGVHKYGLTTDAGEQREIDIAGLPRLPPALNREAPDHATPPTPDDAERFDAGGRGKEDIHEEVGE